MAACMPPGPPPKTSYLFHFGNARQFGLELPFFALQSDYRAGHRDKIDHHVFTAPAVANTGTISSILPSFTLAGQ